MPCQATCIAGTRCWYQSSTLAPRYLPACQINVPEVLVASCQEAQVWQSRVFVPRCS